MLDILGGIAGEIEGPTAGLGSKGQIRSGTAEFVVVGGGEKSFPCQTQL